VPLANHKWHKAVHFGAGIASNRGRFIFSWSKSLRTLNGDEQLKNLILILEMENGQFILLENEATHDSDMISFRVGMARFDGTVA
jgi:hypothetical protein